MIHKINEIEKSGRTVISYKMTDRPGFEDLIFIEGLDNSGIYKGKQPWLRWPKPLEFCKENNSILQSAREAAAFLIESYGITKSVESASDQDQATRTVIIYFHEGKRWFGAVQDTSDIEKNILYTLYNKTKNKLIDSCDYMPLSDISDILDHAKDNNRSDAQFLEPDANHLSRVNQTQ